MEHGNDRFGGGSSGTVLHPLVAVAMVLTIILIMSRPPKQVILPLLLAIFLIPNGQVILLAGVHFTVYRIILLAGLARRMVSKRGSARSGRFNSIDRLVTLWALSLFIIFSLQWQETQALIKSLGDLLDVLAGYFVFRYLIRDREDVRAAIKAFAFIAVIMGVCMLSEQHTGTNVFGRLGGIRSVPEVRGGSIRSQGAFQHSITAGSFGATLLPLLVWLWSNAKYRNVAVLGILGATVMTVTPHSSTTLVCYAAGIFGLCLWPLRKHMRTIRWGIAATLISLHLVMKGPVWSLLEHVDLTGSSESYHRYQLIDTFIRHFGEWWLLGTRNNGSWGWEMADTSNQYVTYGVNGGLVTFVLFISIISRGFGRLGTARKSVEGNRADEWFLWCLGAAFFAHIVVYFGIDYFDQMEFAWLALLTFISAAVFGTVRSRAPRLKQTLASAYELSYRHELGDEADRATRFSTGNK